jgi:hypothetical protein
MVVQEREPALRFAGVTALQSLQVARDGGLGDGKPELEQFRREYGARPRLDCPLSFAGSTGESLC